MNILKTIFFCEILKFSGTFIFSLVYHQKLFSEVSIKSLVNGSVNDIGYYRPTVLKFIINSARIVQKQLGVEHQRRRSGGQIEARARRAVCGIERGPSSIPPWGGAVPSPPKF